MGVVVADRAALPQIASPLALVACRSGRPKAEVGSSCAVAPSATQNEDNAPAAAKVATSLTICFLPLLLTRIYSR